MNHWNKNMTIVSACKSELPLAENWKRHFKLCGMLKQRRIPFKVVQGFYKGVAEVSVMIPGSKSEFAMRMATHYKQESVLIIDEHKEARLHYLQSGIELDLGKFSPVDEATALKHDSFTFDPVYKTYYVCKQGE